MHFRWIFKMEKSFSIILIKACLWLTQLYFLKDVLLCRDTAWALSS